MSAARAFAIARILSALAVIGIAIVIAYLSLVPVEESPAPKWWDKLNHFIAYAGLAAPLALALHPRRWVWALLAAGAYGIALEFAQAFGEAARQGSAFDAVANFLGALLGAGFIRLAAIRRS